MKEPVFINEVGFVSVVPFNDIGRNLYIYGTFKRI